MVEDALSQLGKNVKSYKGKLPLELEGVINGNEIQISGEESSQLLTGLLIALPKLKQDSVIRVANLKSVPYVQMTIAILGEFGINIEHENYEHFKIKGNQLPKSTNYHVEGDWSGASFHLVAAAISGQIEVSNLSETSLQADARILEVLKNCGASVLVKPNSISVVKNELNAFHFDATDCPDLFPPLAVLAACCSGKSRLKGVSRLKHKESDRAKTIQAEFKKLGIEINIDDDEMYIVGGPIHGASVDSHNDHRIAMAMAVLSLVSNGDIEVQNFDAVNKSYPNFLEDFRLALGDYS